MTWALIVAGALASFCPNDGELPGNGANAMLFVVRDDPAGWAGLITSPTLSTSPTSSLYARDTVEHVFDTAAQNWARTARARAKIGWKGWSTTITRDDLDGISSVTLRECDENNNPRPAFASSSSDGAACDMVFFSGGSCAYEGLATGLAAGSGVETNWQRLVAHEMGHCLGLRHPHQQGLHPDCGTGAGCDRCSHHQIMCVSNTCGKNTDGPHPDDVHGQQVAAAGEPFALPEREVWLQTGQFSTANVFSTGNSFYLGDGVYHGRVDCPAGTASPHCVVGRVRNATAIRLDRVTFSGVNPSSATVTTTNVALRTRRAVDVALSRLGGTAVLVAAETDADDTALNTRVLRFAAATNTLQESFDLAGSVTHIEPRVATVSGVGATACAAPLGDGMCAAQGLGSCDESLGICTGGNQGRFLVAIAQPNRALALFMSASNTGAPFVGANGDRFYQPLTVVNGAGAAATVGPIAHAFDIHCADELAGLGSFDERRTCRVAFQTFSAASTVGQLTECGLRIANTGNQATLLGCTSTIGANRDPTVVSLSDYGPSAPITQRQTRSWLLGTSRRVPHQTNENSVIYSYAHSAGARFSSASLNISTYHDTDLGTCVATDTDDELRSYHGGSSIDYCAACQRVVRTMTAQFKTPSFLGGQCW